MGLVLGNPVPEAANLAAAASAFAALPGQASFAATRFDVRGPEQRAAYAPERALAIGSAFKLWSLGALIQDIPAGRRRWDDVVPIIGAARSLPSGRLHCWPVGAPVTLYTLAAEMIRESDNTATDQLLLTLGRERVENAMADMGVREAHRNRPMLTTLELFKLKAGADSSGPRIWAGLDEAGKREYLETSAAVPREAVTSWTMPRELDTLEWFASVADLTRMTGWLHDPTAAGEAAKARGVLSINPGVRLDERVWPHKGRLAAGARRASPDRRYTRHVPQAPVGCHERATLLQRRRRDQAVGRVSVGKVLGLREHRDLWGDGQDSDPTRQQQIVDEGAGLATRLESASRDQHCDLPQRDVGAGQFTSLGPGLDGGQRCLAETLRCERIEDHRMRVEQDHCSASQRSSTGLTTSPTRAFALRACSRWRAASSTLFSGTIRAMIFPRDSTDSSSPA
jgi:beta-lactamase class A